jgi:hypothetical protein
MPNKEQVLTTTNASLLEHALACLDRGWAVFPCYPRRKEPAGEVVPNGVKDATKNRDQVIRWWTKNPNYNPAIGLGLSGEHGLTVLDCDEGLATIEAARAWYRELLLPSTFTVRTGRRNSFGVQFYFSGTTPKKPYEYKGVSGEIRSDGYYVMAPGAIHPDSGEAYVVLQDIAPVPVPPLIEHLSKKRLPNPRGRDPQKLGKGHRHYYLVNRAVYLYKGGLYGDALLNALYWLDENRCVPPKGREHVTKHVYEWVVNNVARNELWRPDDIAVVRRLADDERWQRIFDGDTEDDSKQARSYLIKRLVEVGCNDKEQIKRIVMASQLPEEVLL